MNLRVNGFKTSIFINKNRDEVKKGQQDSLKELGSSQILSRLNSHMGLKGVALMKYTLVERDHFQVVGIKREISFVNNENFESIPKLWDQWKKDGTVDLLFKLNNGEIKGVLGVCAANSHTQSKQVMDYWVATEYDGKTPDGLCNLKIPASKWAVFEVHGPMPEAIQKAWVQIFSEWFPSSGYKHAGTPALEVYTNEDPASPDFYSKIWVPVN